MNKYDDFYIKFDVLNINLLNGEIPQEICNLFELEYLQLGWNSLTGHIPSEIGNLTNLRDSTTFETSSEILSKVKVSFPQVITRLYSNV